MGTVISWKYDERMEQMRLVYSWEVTQHVACP